MKQIKINTKEITREQAYEIANTVQAININELNSFSRKFNNHRELVISRQIGLGDSIIERINRKYYVSDHLIQ